MRKIEDLTGVRFGRLTVIGEGEDYVSPKGEIKKRWLCRCDCGNEVSVYAHKLKVGETTSCGCYRQEIVQKIRRKNLIGQRFGRLVVYALDEASTKKGVRWLCRCDCGNEVSVLSSALLQGRTVSCGCYHKEIAGKYRYQDLTGQRFGKWTVIKRAEGNRVPKWLCRCDCGTISVVQAGNLRNGVSTQCVSCGIKESGAKRVFDLTGQRFGRLTAIRIDESTSTGVRWICRCDCGNEVSVPSGSLTSGNTRSCGCTQSHNENILFNELISYGLRPNIDFVQHITFEGLIGLGGGLLSYDFAIFDSERIVCLIECQGQQHYKPVALFGGKKQFERQREHDRRKKEFAKNNNYPLICLSYKSSIEEIRKVLNEII